MGGFLVNLLNSAPIVGQLFGNGFRPPQWVGPQLTSITAAIPEQSTDIVISSTPQPPEQPVLTPTTFFFDALLRAEHTQELRLTEHPIQNGTSIVDHAYKLPARVSLEIGMSDAMDSYAAGAYSGGSSKSVNAYQTFTYLQSLRLPIQITTRIDTYQNMIIESIRTPDDYRTRFGLKCTIYFRELIVGIVAVRTVSARPNQSATSNEGTVQPVPVPSDLQKYLNSSGLWSSNQPNPTSPPSN